LTKIHHSFAANNAARNTAVKTQTRSKSVSDTLAHNPTWQKSGDPVQTLLNNIKEYIMHYNNAQTSNQCL